MSTQKYYSQSELDEIVTQERAKLKEKVEGMMKDTCIEGHGLPSKYCEDCLKVRAVNIALKSLLAELE